MSGPLERRLDAVVALLASILLGLLALLYQSAPETAVVIGLIAVVASYLVRSRGDSVD